MKTPKSYKSEKIYLQHGLTEIRDNYEPDIFNNPKIKNKTLINSQDQKDEAFYDSDIQSFSSELNLLSQDSNKDLYSHLSRKEQFNSIDEPLSKMLIDIDSQNNLDNKFVYYEDNLDKKELNIKYIKGIILEQMVINYSNVDINYKNNEFFKKIYYNNNLDKNNYISINNYENYNNFNNTNNTKINEAYKNSLKGVSVNKSFSKHVDKRKDTYWNNDIKTKNQDNDENRGIITNQNYLIIDKNLDSKNNFSSDFKNKFEKCGTNNIIHNNTKININYSLEEFLSEINLNQKKYCYLLRTHGFKDIKLLINQEKKSSSNISITNSELKKIGILEPGVRAKILIHLEEKAGNYNFQVPKEVYYNYINCDKLGNLVINMEDENIKKIYNWLKMINVENYLKNFFEGGYYSIELLLMQMNCKNPIEDILIKDELGITKVGHRSRIINKLVEDGKKFLIKLREKTINNEKGQNNGNCN